MGGNWPNARPASSPKRIVSGRGCYARLAKTTASSDHHGNLAQREATNQELRVSAPSSGVCSPALDPVTRPGARLRFGTFERGPSGARAGSSTYMATELRFPFNSEYSVMRSFKGQRVYSKQTIPQAFLKSSSALLLHPRRRPSGSPHSASRAGPAALAAGWPPHMELIFQNQRPARGSPLSFLPP